MRAFYRHYRPVDCRGLVLPNGGVTLRCVMVGHQVFTSVAACSIEDNFSRRAGRVLALKRSDAGEVISVQYDGFKEHLEKALFEVARQYWNTKRQHRRFCLVNGGKPRRKPEPGVPTKKGAVISDLRTGRW